MKIDFSREEALGNLVNQTVPIGNHPAVSVAGHSITIHPSGSRPSIVTTLIKRPPKYFRLSAVMTNPHPSARAVRFTIATYNAGGRSITSSSVTIPGGLSGSIVSIVPEAESEVSVVLSTEMDRADDPPDWAWARFDWVALTSRPDFRELAKASAAEVCAKSSDWRGDLGLASGERLISEQQKYSLTPFVCSNFSELVPEAQSRLRRYLDHPLMDVPPIHMYAIENVTYLPHGVMIADGKVISETLQPVPAQYIASISEMWRAERLNDSDLNIKATIKKAVLVLPQPGEVNYGHWLVEMMPKILPLRESLLRRQVVIGLSEAQVQASFILETLSHMGISKDHIFAIPNSPLVIDQVLYVSPISKHAHPGYISPWSVAALQTWASDVVPGTTGRKLFVSRQDASVRHLLNEAELYKITSAMGYELVCTGNMSIHEQIKLFKSAAEIIGVFGASLTNIAFCAPG